MKAVNSILVPTDFSAASKRALAYAIELADAFGASLHVVHVLEDLFARGRYMDMYAPPGDYVDVSSVRPAPSSRPS